MGMITRFKLVFRSFFLFVFFLISTFGIGQHYPHKVFTKIDGLPTEVIYDMVEDDQGFLWIATGYGISKYDGYSFTNYGIDQGLADIDAFVLRKDRFGRIWVIGNSSRLSILENGRIYPFEFNNILEDLKVICIDLFIDKDNTLHYSSAVGEIIIKSNGEYRIIDSVDAPVNLQVHQTDEGNPYVRQYRAFTPGRPRKHPIRFCLAGKCQTTITSIGSLGRVALKILNDNWVVNIGSDTLAMISANGIFPFAKLESEIRCLSIIENDIWVGTANGIRVISIDDNCKITNARTIYRNRSFSRIYQDGWGGVWCSTINHGMIYIPQLKVKLFSTEDGLSFDLVSAVQPDKQGRIFLGGENGEISVLEPDGNSYLLPNMLRNKRRIRDFFLMSNGDIYFDAYQSEVYRIDSKLSIHRMEQPKTGPFSTIKYIHESDGELFGGTARGIASIVGKDVIRPKAPNQFRLTSFCSKNDSVFYMSTLDGITCFNINSESHWDPFPEFNQRATHILKISDMDYVFSTDGKGIFFIHNDSLINIGKDQGLKKLFFQKLMVNGKTIWGITKHGLTKFEINSLDPLDFTFEEYDYKDGLGYGRLLDLELGDSCIYLASTEGLIVFNEKDAQLNLEPPNIILNKVLVNGLEIDPKDSMCTVQGSSNIEFNFTGLNFVSGGDMLYRYKLEGLHTDWSFTKGRQLQYNTLGPGKYRFLVAARDHKEVWSRELASFGFQVFPPFWQTWWFYVLEALLGSLIIFSLVNWRIRYLHGVEVKKEKEEREKAQLELDALKHQMNPHFLFNTLNSIQAFVSSSDKGEAVRYLSRFSRLIRRNLEHSKDTNVSLKEEIDFLQIYLDLERMRFDNAFDYEIGVDGIQGMDSIRIPNLIVQPYVENAVLHGMNNLKRKGHIKVDFSFEDDMLKCVVEDNGVGRSKEKEEKGKEGRENRSVGMTITQRRLKLLNARIVNPKVQVIDLFENGNPCGTRIEIVMPYLIE